MGIDRMPKAIAVAIFLSLLGLTVSAGGQEPASLVASANGEGTIKLGKEEFELHAIVIKLFEDGKAELQLVTDITVFVNATWTRAVGGAKDIDLKITGNTATTSTLDGAGRLFLNEDRKSIKGLKLQVVNKTSRKVIEVNFIAK
jgi:hypothetical protein